MLRRCVARIEEIDVQPKLFLRDGRHPIQMRCAKDKRPRPIAQPARTFSNRRGLEDPRICARLPALALTHVAAAQSGTIRRTGDLAKHSAKGPSQYVAGFAWRKVD